ncbi:MAG: hypothetical protein K9I36_16695 [Bacteroidia bacterium]|nr:hypothetical protein [Bacteroidia bacterium]
MGKTIEINEPVSVTREVSYIDIGNGKTVKMDGLYYNFYRAILGMDTGEKVGFLNISINELEKHLVKARRNYVKTIIDLIDKDYVDRFEGSDLDKDFKFDCLDDFSLNEIYKKCLTKRPPKTELLVLVEDFLVGSNTEYKLKNEDNE